jgi:hypothetical protein
VYNVNATGFTDLRIKREGREMQVENETVVKLTVVLNRIAESLENIAEELPQLTNRIGMVEDRLRDSNAAADRTFDDDERHKVKAFEHDVEKLSGLPNDPPMTQFSPGLQQRPPIR